VLADGAEHLDLIGRALAAPHGPLELLAHLRLGVGLQHVARRRGLRSGVDLVLVGLVLRGGRGIFLRDHLSRAVEIDRRRVRHILRMVVDPQVSHSHVIPSNRHRLRVSLDHHLFEAVTTVNGCVALHQRCAPNKLVFGSPLLRLRPIMWITYRQVVIVMHSLNQIQI
jgi:hypothetical protein